MTTILGLGAIGIDYIAEVSSYPKEDEKIRTLSSSIVGGGNCANTLTCLVRLGFDTSLISKWGDDLNGTKVSEELKYDNIDHHHSIIKDKCVTGFTYIIVDRVTKTRTCIHTPLSEDILPIEVEPILCSLSLTHHKLIHFDSRHTEAAYVVATRAKAMGIPISIDCEKDRPPYLEKLLPLADYIFTNEHFCKQYVDSHAIAMPNISNEDLIISSQNLTSDDTYDIHTCMSAISSMISFFGHISIDSHPMLLVSTMGSHGALLVNHASNDDVMHVYPMLSHPLNDEIRGMLHRAPIHVSLATVKRSTSAASTELYHIIRVSSWPLHSQDVVDTTGAGDAFIGGFLAGLTVGYNHQDCLRLATTIASIKIQSTGARRGLPTIDTLHHMLSSSTSSSQTSSSSTSSSLLSSSSHKASTFLHMHSS